MYNSTWKTCTYIIKMLQKTKKIPNNNNNTQINRNKDMETADNNKTS